MKTFKNLIYIFSIISTLFLSCSSNNGDDLQDTSDDVITNPDPDDNDDMGDDDQNNNTLTTYDDDVKFVLDNNCVRCHGNPLTNGAPFPLTNFNQATNNISGILNRINSVNNPMPPSGLMSQNNRDIIQQWQTDGLLED